MPASTIRIPLVPYPRSFLGLLLTGVALIVVPLLGLLAYSAWNTQRLIDQSRGAVSSASLVARVSRSLVNRTSQLERLSQQILVAGTDEQLADFERVHGAFLGVAAELARLPLEGEQQAGLTRVIEQEMALHEMISSPARAELDRRAVGELAARVAERAAAVLAISFLVVEREVERLQASAELVQGRLVLMVALGVVLSLVIILAMARRVARPIAELKAAIERLGDADLSRAIHVSGPRDLESIGERLDWLRRRLNELGAEKNRFLRHLSHELKTPLTALREGSELLADGSAGPLSARQAEVVSILRDHSLRLQRMIEELLEHQRALRAAADLRLQPLDLAALVRARIGTHRLVAGARGLSMVCDLDEIVLNADREKLGSIIDNLVGNALKFAPRGGRIEVLAKRDEGFAAIEVRDSGPGIAAKDRALIFDSFFRGSLRQHARVQGTGLGLAVVREYAEAHGGRVGIVEDAGGARIRVLLPLIQGVGPTHGPDHRILAGRAEAAQAC